MARPRVRIAEIRDDPARGAWRRHADYGSLEIPGRALVAAAYA